MRRSLTLVALAAFVLAVAACGPTEEAIDPVAWPFMETTEKLSINGKPFDAYVAKTEAHRARAVNGLAIKEGQAIAYLFPEQEEPVRLKFETLPDPVDLVFVDAAGKALLVESVPAFTQTSFPHQYAAKGARVVLQLRKGMAKDLNISKGADVKTEPSLTEKSKEAAPAFAELFFLRSERPETKPENAPSVQLKVLEKAEEVAQFMKDRDDLKEGQGVLLLIPTGYHEFWLKEVKGKMCACYLERAGQFRSIVISSMYEGIEASGDNDLAQPVYYSPTPASYLAIWKGSDFFSKHGIERRSPVVISGVNATSSAQPDYKNMEVKFGETRLEADLARTDDARKAALMRAPGMQAGKATVLAWDDPSHVEIDAPAGANLWYIKADGGKYTVGEKFNDTKAGRIAAKASSRFVLVVPSGVEATGELKFPYVLRDLRPLLTPMTFYRARAKDVVTDRWPTAEQGLLARARVELALTESEQRQGLMYRTSLRENHGMLFIYDAEQPELTYWMKNCRMNLSIAYLDARGVIVKIHQVMKAPDPSTLDADLERYESGEMAKYAVEFEERWFEKNKIEVGDRMFIPPALLNRQP